MDKQIEEGNEAITRFMGTIFKDVSGVNYPNGNKEWQVKFPDGMTFNHYGKIEDIIVKYTKYHTSWDWLMPVWKRCVEVIGLWCHTHKDINKSKVWLEASEKISRAFSSVDITTAFNEINNLINWYNKQP